MFDTNEFIDTLSKGLDEIYDNKSLNHTIDENNTEIYYLNSSENEDLYLKLYPLYIKAKNYFKTISADERKKLMSEIIEGIHHKAGYGAIKSINLGNELRVQDSNCVLKVFLKK